MGGGRPRETTSTPINHSKPVTNKISRRDGRISGIRVDIASTIPKQLLYDMEKAYGMPLFRGIIYIVERVLPNVKNRDDVYSESFVIMKKIADSISSDAMEFSTLNDRLYENEMVKKV